MVGLRIIAILIFGLLAAKPALSQALPSCISVAADADGDGYGWENDASCIITSTSLTKPSFTNLETGEPVNLVRTQWSPSDFEGLLIECYSRRFDGVSYSIFGDHMAYEFDLLSQIAPYNGNVIENGPAPGGTSITHTWTLSNGIYFGPTDLAITPWVEIVDQEATRIWLTNQSYTQCGNVLSFLPPHVFVPSASLQTDIDNCDYTDANQFNGWGWDPIAMESCAPINSAALDSCDYSNADLHDGWGWNAGTGQSCEPLPSTSLCRDTDGDGWGWDGIASCRVGDLDNIPDPLEALSASTIISPGELLNVPLSCRRVRWLSQFEINPLFDLLDSLNPSRIFFTATFQQDPLDGSSSIEGSWNDVYDESFSLSWDMSTNDVLYGLPNSSGPYPSGILRFHKLDQFIAIDESLSAGSSGDILELITSYCVIQ